MAALCGLPPVISFEGQAAMSLEYLADETVEEAYPIAIAPCGAGLSPDLGSRDGCTTTIGSQDGRTTTTGSRDGHPTIIDWATMVEGVLAKRAAGVPAYSNRRKVPQLAGRGGCGGREMGGNDSHRATADRFDRRLFSKCPAGRPHSGRFGRRRLFGVYS